MDKSLDRAMKTMEKTGAIPMQLTGLTPLQIAGSHIGAAQVVEAAAAARSPTSSDVDRPPT